MSTINQNGELVMDDSGALVEAETAPAKDYMELVGGEGPAFTAELEQFGWRNAGYVDAFDKEAMKPHVEGLVNEVRYAAENPEKFDYLLIVAGKDGRKPFQHGTLPAGLAASILSFTTDPFERYVVDGEINRKFGGDPMAFYYETMTTRAKTKEENAPKVEDVQSVIDGDFNKMMEALGFTVITGDSLVDVLEVEDGAGDETTQAQAGSAEPLTDLNGDGVIDEKDEDIRLHLLADDGCPHCNKE